MSIMVSSNCLIYWTSRSQLPLPVDCCRLFKPTTGLLGIMTTPFTPTQELVASDSTLSGGFKLWNMQSAVREAVGQIS